MILRTALATLIALLFALPIVTHAQGYPSKPVRLVIPFAAGGAADTVARALGNRLSETIGQPVVIDNRPGGNAMIGTDAVAKAAPDGYTLLMAVGPPHSVFELFSKKVPFDSVRDFTPISVVGTAPQAIVLHPSVPATTLKEFIDYAKKNPGKVSFGTSASGSSQHLGGLLVNRVAGIDMVHVPYKGGAPALNDVLGGQIPVAILVLSNIIPHVKSGKLRVLATLEAQRATAAPEVPTMAEAGLTGHSLPDTWVGVVGPAKLPAPIVTQLHAAIIKALQFADVRARLEAAGFEVKGNTPQQFTAQVEKGFDIYKRIAADAGIQPE